MLVVLNWGVFIWASIHGHVVESGLGYLVAPFVAIGVGAVWFKETLAPVRLGAIAVITLALALLIHGSGELSHWIYLTIGGTWGAYAGLKKLTKLDSFSGLLMETLVLAVLVLVLCGLGPWTLKLPDNLGAEALALLALCGAVSVIPLALFSFAAAKLPLIAMGLLQFVLPSTQFVVALAIYGQKISDNTVLAFAVMWLCLAVVGLEPAWKAYRQRRAV